MNHGSSQHPDGANGAGELPRDDAERLDALLALEALDLLDDAEATELSLLRAARPEAAVVGARSLHETTAAVLASAERAPLPTGLVDTLVSTADEVLGDRAQGAASPSPIRLMPNPVRESWGAGRPEGAGQRKIWTTRLVAVGGYALAACLLIALLHPPATAPADSDAVSARAALLTRGARSVAWTATGSVPGVGGDVVWSDAEQRGYMRFVGLRPNDPTQSQYQLWVFDRDRPEATPVDGGVFDVSASGELVVPIRTKLAVGKATLFAVTEERPGGVVVSDRKKLHVLAKVDG